MVNARVETASTSAYFKNLWKKARILIPADGWFKWHAGRVRSLRAVWLRRCTSRPYYIQRADGEPMFLAALTSILTEADAAAPGAGFVIVTAAADEGLLDVHDRRPLVVLASERAPLAGRRSISRMISTSS